MNKITIIGNLTRDPELRTTASGVQVCSFTVAVNKRNKDAANAADFFRVTAWRGLADICARYIAKGSKVACSGSVSVSTYTGNDGQTRATLEVTADDVEFLSANRDPGTDSAFDATRARKEAEWPEGLPKSDVNGYVEVDEELPF
jgi:single-strand DNA-binding protein